MDRQEDTSQGDGPVPSPARRPSRLRTWCVALCLALPAAAPAQAPGREDIAFVDVNVVPMDRERVLRGQTVLVRDGRIEAIAPRLQVPAGARRIEGGGKLWLSPGLADMHQHADSRQALAVQLANGITTTVNMGEAGNAFVGRTRQAVEKGEVPGPRTFVALAVDGSPRYGHLVVRDADDARATLQVARANGYDFIKVYNDLGAAAFDAFAREAPAAGLQVVGHGVAAVGLAQQIARGQVLVAHAEEFFYTWFPPPPEHDPNAPPPTASIPELVAQLRDHGTYVGADLVTYATIAAQWGRPDAVRRYLRDPRTRTLAPEFRASWPRAGYARKPDSLERRLAFLRTLVKALDQAGVPLLSGTDSPDIPGLWPGFSLHDNLALLVEAGLSPYRALSTATRVPGEFIARTCPGAPVFGVVAPGYRADLVLTTADPLGDLSTLRTPVGVMADGRWYDSAALHALLEGVERDYALPAP